MCDFLRNIRALYNESIRYSGMSENWWGWLGPRPHTNETTTASTGASWTSIPPVAAGEDTFTGR